MWDQRRPIGRDTARAFVLLAMVVVAGALLFVIPEPESDPVAAAYALQADGDPSSPTTDHVDGDDSSPSTFEVSDAVEAREPAVLVGALSASDAVAELNVLRLAQRATTTEAPTTTEQVTTAPPTTAAPTTTAPPSTAETTEATEAIETTESSQTSESGPADTTDGDSEGGDSTNPEPETTTTTAPTTTAPPTTAAENGFVDAGHGVYVPPVLLKIRWCESNDNYTAANPSSSARGAYQFLTGSWSAYGHASRYGVSQAHLASPAQQDEAALITWQRDGTRPWLASKHCWG